MINLGIDEIVSVLSVYTGIIVFLLTVIVIPLIKFFLKRQITAFEEGIKKMEKNLDEIDFKYDEIETKLSENFVHKESCDLRHQPITETLNRLQRNMEDGFNRNNDLLMKIVGKLGI